MNREAGNLQIRVFIVDDSAFMRTAISRMVASDPALRVVGTASTGEEALQRIPALDPDVITLDIEMPGIGGMETLKRIMREFPRPVIMLSSVIQREAEKTFAALQVGAFDYISKQLSSASLDILHVREDLVAKIKAAAGLRAPHAPLVLSKKPAHAVRPDDHDSPPISIVAIGISTGGPKALQDILPTLPADLPVPIVIVQHMPSGFTGPFAQRLDNLCSVSIHEAAQHEAIQPGVVYIAPAGSHLTLDRSGGRAVISLSDKPGSQLHTPSVDIMMQSVAAAFGNHAMGIIMTGMGADGAQGMSAIHREGGITLGQDESSCAVYGMPRVCAEMGILDRVVPLARIPHEILQAARHARKASAG